MSLFISVSISTISLGCDYGLVTQSQGIHVASLYGVLDVLWSARWSFSCFAALLVCIS